MRNTLLQLGLVLLAAVTLTPGVALAAGGGDGEDLDYSAQMMHHISDANEMHFWGDIHIPLPILAYSHTDGLFAGMSSMFYGDDHHGDHHHGDHGHDHGDHDHAHAEAGGHHGPTRVIDGYFLDHGVLRRLSDPAARANVTEMERVEVREIGGGEEALMLLSGGRAYGIEDASTLLAFTDWIDFSITKNVATMLMAMLVFGLVFFAVRSGYSKNRGRAPKGIQSFFEPIILFIRDDIAKEMIGPKWERYFPFLCTLFFFILIVNLFGLIPIAPFGANVTGNIGLTLTLAIFTFAIVNLSGNRHYWGHVFWMPGVPVFLKPLMAIVEIIGLFVKPFTLMVRLFANITAGHIVLTVFVGLIFVTAQSLGSEAGYGVSIGSAILTIFMMAIELLVAFLQAFVFTILTASYLGAATEEAHH